MGRWRAIDPIGVAHGIKASVRSLFEAGDESAATPTAEAVGYLNGAAMRLIPAAEAASYGRQV